MAPKLKQHLRGIAEPVLRREPLFVRSCTAFVDNLTRILQTTLIVGAIFLAQEFRSLAEDLPQAVAEFETEPAAEHAPFVAPEPQESVLTERVKHYLNCTYEDYRITRFEECVEAPSRIYRGPQAVPDDRGNVSYDLPVLLASLDDYTGFEQARLN